MGEVVRALAPAADLREPRQRLGAARRPAQDARLPLPLAQRRPFEEREGLELRIRNLDLRIAREDDLARQQAAAQAAKDQATRDEIARDQQKPWLLGAIVGGAGGVLVIAGVVVDLIANAKRPAASLCKTTGGVTLCQTAAQDPIALSNRMAIAGDATWIAGAAAVAAGVVLVIVRRPAPQADAGPQAAPPPPAAYLAPRPGGLTLGGSF